MKEKVRITDYAQLITEKLSKGILLNTKADKFNSMVIGWGHLGTVWGRQTFIVYVRQSRYTKQQLDAAGEFTVSVPLGDTDMHIWEVCGRMSGRDTDKAAQAGLTLEEPEMISTPGVKEYPLTIECKVLYSQDQVLEKLPEDIRTRTYADGDFHTMYVGEILDAYIIK
ncbi:MAG: flavin reductase [Lachnospiraceae bacterium]|nr:flavin reductase [Lachnospiraceae bacterium]